MKFETDYGGTPKGWTDTTWGELIELVYGKALGDRKDPAGVAEVFGTNGPTGIRASEAQGSGPTVVIGRKGAYRGVQWASGPFWVIDTAFHIRPKTDLYLAWAFRALSTVDINGMDSGSAIPSTRREDLYGVAVALPPLDEQRRIAWLLDSLDDKIENNQRIAKTLEEIAATLFKARFVDFVDHDDLVESEIGPIPTGWGAIPVGDLAKYVNGKAFTKFGNGRGRMVIRIAELRSGPGGSTVYTDHEAESDFVAQPGDLLFAWSGSLDIYRWHREEALINQHIFKVVPEGHPAWFVFHALKHVMPHFQAIAADKATTMGHIKRSHLVEYRVAVPPPEDLARHDAEFAPLFAQALQAQMETETLTRIRDELLPRLISGRIRVPAPDGEESPT